MCMPCCMGSLTRLHSQLLTVRGSCVLPRVGPQPLGLDPVSCEYYFLAQMSPFVVGGRCPVLVAASCICQPQPGKHKHMYRVAAVAEQLHLRLQQHPHMCCRHSLQGCASGAEKGSKECAQHTLLGFLAVGHTHCAPLSTALPSGVGNQVLWSVLDIGSVHAAAWLRFTSWTCGVVCCPEALEATVAV